MTSRMALGLAAAAAAALAATTVAAEPVELRFGFPAPATSFVNTKGMTPWIRQVEKASDGTLKIKLFAGPTLGDFRTIYDRTIKGVADIAFGVFGTLAGQFPRTQVSALPYESDNSTEASVALWRLEERGLLGNEFDKVRVLALFNFPSAHIHTKKPIRAIDDLKGMKLSVSSRLIGQIVAKLGAAPVPTPPPAVYQGIARGVTDGAVIAWTAVQTFRLQEVTSYHLQVPLGMSPAYVFMNKAAYARLPDKAKQAIDRYAGAPFSANLGREVDVVDVAAAKRIGAMPGQEVSEVPASQVAAWQARVKSVVDGWAGRTPDGAKVLAAFRDEVRKIRKGM